MFKMDNKDSNGDVPKETDNTTAEDNVETTEFVKDVFLASDEELEDNQELDENSEEEQFSDDSGSSIASMKTWAKWISGTLLTLLSIYILFNFVFKTYVVDGLSMYPEFDDKNRVVLWATDKTLADIFSKDYVPSRGEVIVVSSPIEEDIDLIKRVIALPGERVVLEDGVFTVYNDEFPDGFDPDKTHEGSVRSTDGAVDITVPEGHLFLVGDNREKNSSFDSRNGLGTVPLDNIQGRVLLRFLPVFDFKVF